MVCRPTGHTHLPRPAHSGARSARLRHATGTDSPCPNQASALGPDGPRRVPHAPGQARPVPTRHGAPRRLPTELSPAAQGPPQPRVFGSPVIHPLRQPPPQALPVASPLASRSAPRLRLLPTIEVFRSDQGVIVVSRSSEATIAP